MTWKALFMAAIVSGGCAAPIDPVDLVRSQPSGVLAGSALCLAINSYQLSGWRMRLREVSISMHGMHCKTGAPVC